MNKCWQCGDEIPKGYTHMCGIGNSGTYPWLKYRWRTLFGPVADSNAVEYPAPQPEEERARRCQASNHEGGQCELREGHKGQHLAGMIMWFEPFPKPKRERRNEQEME